MWLTRAYFILAIVCVIAQGKKGDSRTVVIDQGPVRGYKDPEGGVFVFYNIPYATAPKGKDRFKAALPAPKWVSTFEAVNRRIICPQVKMIIGLGKDHIFNGTMQEDCLVANVYVPDTNKKNLPVVVHVHGGLYLLGLGDFMAHKDMVRTKNVIYVNFNYRLGAHGFLCLGTPDAPGNAGMKDMVALLRWVKRNIASFGGNPDDVTIEGYDAGSSAVDLLLLSKSAKGLFHKAIPESGANLAMWSLQTDPIYNAKHFAKYELGFQNIDDFYALEEFYKTVSYDELVNKDGYSLINKNINNFMFTPCVERDTGSEMFLDDSPLNILKKGDFNKVPLLYGFTDKEGLFRVSNSYHLFVPGMINKFSDFLPHDLKFRDENEKEMVADVVKKFYFRDKKIDYDTILQYIDYYSDIMFAYPHLRSLKLQVEAGNDQIYLYQFSHPFRYPVPEGVTVEVNGSNHCAQSFVVADDLHKHIDNVEKIINVTRQFWLNFITTSKPVSPGSKLPAWPAASAQGSPYMDITEQPRLLAELLPERRRLWDAIYERYYHGPKPPPEPPVKHTEL